MAGSFTIPDKARVLEAWEPVSGRPAALALYRGKYAVGSAKWVALADFAIVLWPFIQCGPSGRHKEAGRELGIKITGKNAPPSDLDLYLQWCRRNGVQPLSSRKDSPH